MYNKSEIMKKAWSNYRTGHYATFRNSLEQAWREAKREVEQRLQGFVKVTEINAGDTIEMEYGDYGNVVTCVVTNVSSELFMNKYIVIDAVSATDNKLKLEFCIEPIESIKRVAQFTQLQFVA